MGENLNIITSLECPSVRVELAPRECASAHVEPIVELYQAKATRANPSIISSKECPSARVEPFRENTQVPM